MKEGLSVGVIGATGYVGGRLVGWLTERCDSVRVFGLDKERMEAREWYDRVDPVIGRLSDEAALDVLLDNVHTLYFLVPFPRFEDAASGFRKELSRLASMCREAGVRQIVVLSEAKRLSRYDTAPAFRAEGLPVIHLMCAPIIGSGSRLFEMIRSSVERSPMVFLPAWADREFHTISIRTVLQYLVHCLDPREPLDINLVIGSRIPTSMRDLLLAYARMRDLKRFYLRARTARFYRFWLLLVTPLPRPVIRRTLDGIHQSMGAVPEEHDAFAVPDLSSLSAVRFALKRFAADSVATSWTDAIPDVSRRSDGKQRLARRHEMITERVEADTDVPRQKVFTVLSRIGGESGWPYANALWKLRGWLDILFGGVGLRATRRSTETLRVGDSVDFWRVEAIEEGRLLRFRAEMKLPGRAWLQYELSEAPGGGTRISQTAFFDPHGILGRCYWYAMYVPHLFIFPGLIRRIVEASTSEG